MHPALRTIVLLLCGLMAVPVAALPGGLGVCPAAGTCGGDAANGLKQTTPSCCPQTPHTTTDGSDSATPPDQHVPHPGGCNPDCLACCHARATIAAPALTSVLEKLPYVAASPDTADEPPTPDRGAIFHPPKT